MSRQPQRPAEPAPAPAEERTPLPRGVVRARMVRALSRLLWNQEQQRRRMDRLREVVR